MTDRTLATLAWVGVFNANTLFELVPIGGKFRLSAKSIETYTKTSARGWYQDANGRKYRTGIRTAVFVEKKVAKQNEATEADRQKLIDYMREGKVAVGKPHPDPFVNAVWCLIYSMVERGVNGGDPWWGQDFLTVKRLLEEKGLNCDPRKTEIV